MHPAAPFSLPPSFALRRRSWLAGGLAILCLASGAGRTHAQQPEATPAPLAENASLRQMMTPEQFKSAGLKKLSPAELQSLERFLKGYRDQVVQESVKATEERVNPAPRRDRATAQNVIESKIQGHFAGLTGRTRVLLDNGSIWQQIDTAQKYPANLDSPDVVLVRTIFGYKMYVSGALHWFYVKQVIVR